MTNEQEEENPLINVVCRPICLNELSTIFQCSFALNTVINEAKQGKVKTCRKLFFERAELSTFVPGSGHLNSSTSFR